MIFPVPERKLTRRQFSNQHKNWVKAIKVKFLYYFTYCLLVFTVDPKIAFSESQHDVLLAGFDVPRIGRQKQSTSKQTIDTLTNHVGIEFILVPAGEFLMGSIDGDVDEQPIHRQRIDQPFYISKFEITQQQWKKVMGTEPWNGRNPKAIGDNFPAIFVSWVDAQRFISRLNTLEECSCYSLPNEIHWEYAARAGTSARYSFGNNKSRLGEYAWYAKNSMDEQHAQPVGRKKSNPWGLYDMEGNVWEWIKDSYSEDIGPRIRGGSWASPASSLRPANRSAAQRDRRASHIGFRIYRAQQ